LLVDLVNRCGKFFLAHTFLEFEDVLKELSGDPVWCAGLLPNQLAIGALYPHKQREFSITQVGSIWMLCASIFFCSLANLFQITF